MRSKHWRFVALLVLVVVVSVTPAFAEGCETCMTYSSGTAVYTWCNDVRAGEMGNLKCRVECYSSDELGACACTESGDWCMVIFVEG